jgi:hypothetical protein
VSFQQGSDLKRLRQAAQPSSRAQVGSTALKAIFVKRRRRRIEGMQL